MIVPQTRLLVWVALLVVPFATVAAVFPESAFVAGGLILLLLLLVVMDAAMAHGSLEGISVEMPKVVRLSKDREGSIEMQIRNELKQARRLRLGLAFPKEIDSPDEDLVAVLPAKTEFSRLNWLCTPRQRGSYLLDKYYLEGLSQWGFWAVRSAVSARSEIRVYPNLLSERKGVAALFLNRGNFGAHALRQVGKGRDFEKLREYIPGDNYDDVHWKATAKRGRPVTKVFQIERTQEVYVIIDASRLSARGQVCRESRVESREQDALRPSALVSRPSTTTLERFITAGLILGVAAEQQGDLFGLLTFSDKVHGFVRAKNGQAHYNACRDALYTLQPRIVTPDFDELCAFIRLRLRRRALLVFLTALDDPVLAESFVRNLDLICRQHLILVNMMQPARARPLFTEDGVASLDDVYRQLGGHVLWHNLRELDKVLQRRGVRFSMLNDERLSAQLVTQYLNVKRRQLI